MPKKKAGLVLVVAAVICALWFSGLHKEVTLERIREQREFLHLFVQGNYVLSVFTFLLLIFSTAFFVPGAIVLMLAGGFLFGVLPGLFFSVAGLTLGAVAAFLSVRYVLGSWLQDRYKVLLAAFNKEMHRHGHYYFITLRIVPVLPFSLVNILAGLTRISLTRFAVSTFVGLLPAAFVYSFAGRRLAEINSPWDVLSPGMIGALFLLGTFSLLPVILKIFGLKRKKER